MKLWLAMFSCLGAVMLPGALPAAETEPQTWTSSEGRTLQAELLDFSDQAIKVKRESDGTVFQIPLERLSDADKAKVMVMVRRRKRDNGLKQGLYAPQITGQFAPGKSKEGLNFQLFGKPDWDGTKRYPLVLWLHGAGQCGEDNTKQLAGHPEQWFTPDAQLAKPCFGLAPQCFSKDIGWKDQPAEDIVALIKSLIEELPVDEGRLYVTGASMGGTGTWYMLAQWPKMFACGVPLCGSPDVKTVGAVRDIPVWVFHGEQDEQVPVDRSRAMVAALQAIDGKVMYTEIPGQGHNINGLAYGKPTLHDWLFQQRRGDFKGEP